MKAIKYLLFAILILVIGISIYIAVQPNSFEVKRTRTINAPSAVIYNNVIDFKNWEAWSSWVEKDPETVITLGDTTAGVGGSYSWVDSHGLGKMTTLATNPNQSIEQELQFEDFEPSKITWNFEPTDDGKTNVTWKMNSEKVPFMFKANALLKGGFDNMIGPDFERGLEKLDSLIVESMMKYSVKVDGIANHGGGYFIYNTTSCKMDDIEAKMTEMLSKIGSYAMKNRIAMAGAPYVNYHKWDEANNAVIFSCCIPTTNQVITTESDILSGQLEPFKAVKTTLKGNYTNLKEAWDETFKYIENYQLVPKETGPMLEVYLTDPESKPNPADWITEIYIAIEE
ncbi:transcription activator effector-binding protein [Hanstruepera neustonica]|uniref:Transcription activator effector-binding protein n=1 Tax=Hanstruepera neustonica TaxID=1445657 RepID=A0A2K1DZB1_9FLAO|nr:SRPBCC family protein [Hanstruepera neustonica]PNQ73370.1 transcription activator effector-binding protein [Hanstruepera neustonica]